VVNIKARWLALAEAHHDPGAEAGELESAPMIGAPEIAFHEVMRGGFSQGVRDPAGGEREGTRAGSVLTLHVTAAIPDIAAFVRDPDHEGALTGTVTVPPVGADASAASGAFRLFASSPDPDLKLMIYRVTFAANGTQYCLDGAKHVRRHSVLRAWRDTTTLSCRLHAGVDPAADVVGAGILRLSPLAFARQLASFRTPAAHGFGSVAALARFLAFFSTELIDSYVMPRRRT
jgi:cholesterol oxidase